MNTWAAYARLMRLDKPIGTYLLLWPTLWALWLAADGNPNHLNLIVFTLGVIVMRAAGCVINDIADRHIDKHVSRTQARPLTSGEVSLTGALVLFFTLCLLAFGLVLLLNPLTVMIAVIAVALAILYPFTKRWIPIPQVVLGMAWYLAVPMAYAAECQTVPVVAWLLYLAVIAWTVGFDTIYAMMDMDDDRRLGLRSAALWFGAYRRWAVGGCYALFYGLWLVVAKLTSSAPSVYVGLLGAGGLLGYQFWLIRPTATRKPKYLQAFQLNHWVGSVIFVGLLFGY